MMTRTVDTVTDYSLDISEAFNKVQNELHLFQLYDFLYSMANADRQEIEDRQYQVWT